MAASDEINRSGMVKAAALVLGGLGLLVGLFTAGFVYHDPAASEARGTRGRVARFFVMLAEGLENGGVMFVLLVCGCAAAGAALGLFIGWRIAQGLPPDDRKSLYTPRKPKK